jgi:hypothetical protein
MALPNTLLAVIPVRNIFPLPAPGIAPPPNTVKQNAIYMNMGIADPNIIALNV